MLNLNELGLDPDEIELIKQAAKEFHAEWVRIKEFDKNTHK